VFHVIVPVTVPENTRILDCPKEYPIVKNKKEIIRRYRFIALFFLHYIRLLKLVKGCISITIINATA
jgi:hypothetical protein